ncbi:MAG: Hsp20/alpha crystallin family protein [Spirochaetes bacterium]|nr:Hsp20/alpha crystallin family protein [Spirochaetota bacterium]
MFTTYDVFDDLLNFRNAVDRFFDELSTYGRKYDMPYVNLYEKGDHIAIKALLAGVKPEDVEIHLVENSLVLEGEKKADYVERPYIRKERHFGKFKKSIRLPYRVDPSKVQATMKNGVLIIKLEKSEEAKPRRIEIK